MDITGSVYDSRDDTVRILHENGIIVSENQVMEELVLYTEEDEYPSRSIKQLENHIKKFIRKYGKKK